MTKSLPSSSAGSSGSGSPDSARRVPGSPDSSNQGSPSGGAPSGGHCRRPSESLSTCSSHSVAMEPISEGREERSYDSHISQEEQDLLLKLEAANRLLEQDERSVAKKSRDSPNQEGAARSAEDSTSIISVSSLHSNQPDAEHGMCGEEDVDAWGKILKDWHVHYKKRPSYIKELVRKGIPHHFRCIVWQHLSSNGSSAANSRDLFSEYLKQTSACEKVIRRDIARTYPEHDFFREKDGLGQESLFNVMKAYSLHDREVGYCQGSGFIVGLLLMLMPEEEAFGVLVQIMTEYRMRELFKPSMAELGLCMYQLEFLIQESMPGLYKHFQSQTFHTSMYASSWFLTLFTTTLPIALCFRIMDVFLSEGMEIVFRIGMAILKASEEDLLCLDMEGMLQYLNETVPIKYQSDAEGLLKSAFQVKYNAKKMKKLEKEYSVLKAKENEDQVELRRLRSENRLLKHRIEILEKENVTLAEKLIQGQVSLAQGSEETYALKRDLSQSRDLSTDLAHKLTAAQAEIEKFRASQAMGDPSTNHFKAEVLQEELIAVKLREAEAGLSLTEMRAKVQELERDWEKYMNCFGKDKGSPATAPGKTPTVQAVLEELMFVKLREAENLAEAKELRQKVLLVETQSQVGSHQIQKLNEEIDQMGDKLSEKEKMERALKANLKELQRKIADDENKSTEDAVLLRIKEAENSQTVAELRQQIMELEIRNQELVATHQIVDTSKKQNLQNEITDLKDEILQYKLQKKPVSFSTLDVSKGCFDSDSDSEGGGRAGSLGAAGVPRSLSLSAAAGALGPDSVFGDQCAAAQRTEENGNGLRDDLALDTKSVDPAHGAGDASAIDTPRKKLTLRPSMTIDSMDNF